MMLKISLNPKPETLNPTYLHSYTSKPGNCPLSGFFRYVERGIEDENEDEAQRQRACSSKCWTLLTLWGRPVADTTVDDINPALP